VNTAVPPVELAPLDDTTADNAYRETLEAMRVRVPAGAPVVAPTYLFASTNDTEIYVIHPNHPVAQRADPFARRVWRDGEALDWGASTDGNSYRISVEANVLKAKASDYSVQMPRANVYDVVTNTLVGPLTYAFGRYTLMTEDTPAISTTVDAFTNYPPQAPDRLHQYSVATMNVENLYDYLNDPFDNCDFDAAIEPGCSGVTPPFNYVPASLAAYQTHLAKLAQEVNAAANPDIIAVEEAEDQDVCVGGGQIYGTCPISPTNNADGQLDALQDLVREIYIRSGNVISYQIASDRAGADYRGIIVGYLYRADRVELVPTSTLSADPVLGLRPTDPVSNTYPHNILVLNPKAMQTNYSGGGKLFERLPQAALFRVHRASVADNDWVEVYAFGNHFKSGPDTNIQLRTEQAAYNAQLVTDTLTVKPNARAAVLGDLNVYPDSTQLAALYIKMSNLHYNIPAASRYSYIFQGQTQTLDQIFVTGALSQTLAAARVAHVNADWSYDYAPIRTTNHQASDHDSTVATFNLPLLPADLSASSKSSNVAGQVLPGSLITYTIVLSNSGGLDAAARITDVLGSYYVVHNAMGLSQPTTGTLTWSGPVTAGQSLALSFVVQVVGLTQLPVGTTILSNSVRIDDGVHAPFDVGAPNPPSVEIYGIYLPIVSRN
jgi:predicted extracellular nuclease